MRTPRQSLSRSSSSSSNYRSGPVNLVEEFSNSTPTQNIVRSEPQSTVIKRTDLIKQQLEGIFGASSARKSPALNSEERKFVEKTLKKQNLDPSNLSPVNPDIIRKFHNILTFLNQFLAHILDTKIKALNTARKHTLSNL